MNYHILEGSLEVKLPIRWTDEKAEVGRVREEKVREEKRREEKRREEKRKEEKNSENKKSARLCRKICGWYLQEGTPKK